MTGKIFVNYRRDDERAVAARIRDRLASAFGSANVFMDVDNLMAGQRFDKELETALVQTDIFVAVIGPKWATLLAERTSLGERDYVREEIASALKRGLVVIPVLVEQAQLPRADAMAEDIRELVLHQKSTVTHEHFGRDIGALVDAVKFVRKNSRKRKAKGRFLSGSFFVSAAIVVMLMFALIGLYNFSTRHPPNEQSQAQVEAKQAADNAERQRQAEIKTKADAVAKQSADDAERQRQAEMKAKADAAAKQVADDAERQRQAEVKAKSDAVARQAADATPRQQQAEIKPKETNQAADPDSQKRSSGAPMLEPALAVGPGSGRSFRDDQLDGKPCPYCPDMVVIPAGSFNMGSSDGEERYHGYNGNEKPRHKVTFATPFAVGMYPITLGEFREFVKEHGYATSGGCIWNSPGIKQTDQHPVVCISWNDAISYAAWLSVKTGKHFRLLTEAEREYVTRAGTVTPFWWGIEISTRQANYDGTHTYGKGTLGEFRKGTVPVNSFDPNAWGLYQVHGNVSEWCEDNWHKDYVGDPPNDGSAWPGGDPSRRVFRGGSWNGYPGFLRSAFRDSVPRDYLSINVGFRLARVLVTPYP